MQPYVYRVARRRHRPLAAGKPRCRGATTKIGICAHSATEWKLASGNILRLILNRMGDLARTGKCIGKRVARVPSLADERWMCVCMLRECVANGGGEILIMERCFASDGALALVRRVTLQFRAAYGGESIESMRFYSVIYYQYVGKRLGCLRREKRPSAFLKRGVRRRAMSELIAYNV